jgi:4-amino-4-deoxy-L-arabinose transferase-like glycosyltransferase
LPLLLLPLYPPTAFDATMYHLAYVRAFARENGLVFLPNLRFPVFPQSAELLFSSMWIFGGDTASQLVSLLATLLTALLLCLRWRIGASREQGLLAAATWLGNPIVVFLAGAAYVEPCLVLFATGAIHSALRWKETGREGWLAVAGALAGAAAAVKYPGLFFAAALLFFAAVAGSRRGRAFRAVLVYSACLLAFLLPTYARIASETGNPVFPFLPDVFGSSLWSLEEYDAVAPGSAPVLDGHGSRGVLPGLLGLLRLPFDAVFERARWGGQPPISPIYLLSLPLALAAAVRDRFARGVVLFSMAYLLLSLALPRDVRFVLPLLPLWSLAGARALHGGVSLLSASVPRRAAAGLLAGLLALPGFLYSLYALRRAGPLPVTPPARERYLARNLPLYPAIAFLNRSYGPGWTAYAFHAERMAYFAEGVLWGDWFGPGSYRRMLGALSEGEALAAGMRRLGARYLIVPEGRGLHLPQDGSFRRRFRQVYRDEAARIFEAAL